MLVQCICSLLPLIIISLKVLLYKTTVGGGGNELASVSFGEVYLDVQCCGAVMQASESFCGVGTSPVSGPLSNPRVPIDLIGLSQTGIFHKSVRALF